MSDEKDKKEESQSTTTKIVVAVFGTVIAPVLVAAGIKFSDSLFSSPAPANPDPPKPAAEAKPATAATTTAAETKPESPGPATATAAATPPSTTAAAPIPTATAANGWTPLFNGRDLAGWSVAGNYLDRWSANTSSKALVGTAEEGKKSRNWLFTDEDFADFRLRFEFKLAPDSESGIAVRTPHSFNVKDGRMAIALTNDSAATAPTGTLVTWSGGNSHVQAAPRTPANLRAGDMWNNFELEFRGAHLNAAINGEALLNLKLDDRRGKGSVGLQRPSGRIALECKSGRVEFRNMEVQRLK